MNIKRTALLGALLILPAFSGLFAETIIQDIRFIGLKRTRTATAEAIIRPLETGKPFTSDSEEIIIQKLREAGIFNPEIEVKTEISDDLANIEVYVKDRWTLIPIPIISVTGDGDWKAGLLAIESNILGFNKTMGLGFFLGSDGWSLLNFYQDPRFLESDFELSTSISLGLDENSDLNSDEDVLRDYQSDKVALGLGLGYPLTERLTVKGDWDYNRADIRDNPKGLDDLNATGVGGELEWKDLYYDIPFEYGLNASGGMRWNWGFQETENFPVAGGKLKWALNPFGKQQLAFLANGGWSSNLPAPVQERLGGRPGSLTLPSNKIAAESFVNSAVKYSIPVWTLPFGSFAVNGFYEVGTYESDIQERELYHGPGGGFELYINDLAIPAIQFNIAWNLENGSYQISAGVGMGGGG